MKHFLQYKLLTSFAALLVMSSMVLSGCTSSQRSTSGQRIIKTANGHIVEVEFYELKIHMPTVIPQGNITFRLMNPSSNDHGFKIKGNGIEEAYPMDINEGETKDWTINLKPGSYGVICPLIGHLDLGERLDLTVTP